MIEFERKLLLILGNWSANPTATTRKAVCARIREEVIRPLLVDAYQAGNADGDEPITFKPTFKNGDEYADSVLQNG